MSTLSVTGLAKTAVIIAAAVAVSLPAWPYSPAFAADPVPADILASDNFERSLANGWGTADKGGAWTSSLDTKVSVGSSRGRVAPRSGQSVVQKLSTSLTDMRATVSVQVDALPVAGNGMSANIGVRASGSGAYVADLRFGKSGALSLNIKRERTGFPDVILVSDALLPTRAVAGTPYVVQVEVAGESRVEIRARAWRQSTAPPSWQVSASDSDPARLTGPGGLALRSYLSGSTSPMTVSYDDVTVHKLAAAGDPSLPPVVPTVPPVVPTVPPVVPTVPPVVPGVPPTEPVIPPVVPPVVAPGGSAVGSVPVGSASYAVPAGAVFVTASGSRTGSGTVGSPYGSLAFAIEKAVSGSTIVMRGGIYRESTKVPFKKRLTIQSYPKEAVWLDGSSPVSGWQRSGNAWVVSNWDHVFDHRVSDSQGVDESKRYISPDSPMAGHPDQVWVSGVRLRQVGSVGAVVSGTFFVDEAGRRLYVGTDPSGKLVEASTLQQGMVIVGTGTTVRGIGARRYANTFWMGGAISAQVDNITLENVVASQNATLGVNGWGKKMRLNRISLTENGALGLGLNTAHDLVLTDSLIQANNLESFKEAPVSGGVKITRSLRVLISGNNFDQNRSTGLWFDNWASEITVVGNRFSGNGSSGLLLEALSKAVVADNYFVDNAKAGLYIIDANDIAVWNNTFHANEMYSIRLYQDERRSSNPVSSLVIRDVSMRNNVISYGTGSCQYLVHDNEKKVTGQTMRVTSESNAYHRANSASPANMVCWANGSTGLASFKTLTAFRAATGNDLKSTLHEGAPILTSAYQLTPGARVSTAAVALPIPNAVASAIGVAANTKTLGAVSPMIK